METNNSINAQELIDIQNNITDIDKQLADLSNKKQQLLLKLDSIKHIEMAKSLTGKYLKGNNYYIHIKKVENDCIYFDGLQLDNFSVNFDHKKVDYTTDYAIQISTFVDWYTDWKEITQTDYEDALNHFNSVYKKLI